MKVAISTLIVRRGRSGSNESYLVNLLRGLAAVDAANEYVLFVTRGNEDLFRLPEERFRLHRLPVGDNRLLRILYDQFVVPFLASRAGAAVLHYPGTVGSFFRRRAVQQVVTIHYDIGGVHARSVSLLKKLYYSALMVRTRAVAKGLIVPSRDFGAKFARNWKIAADKIRVVHHGVARTAESDGPSRDFILSVTNALPHKNTATLLEAWARWSALRNGEVPRLVLAGNLGERDLEMWMSACRARGVEVPREKVQFTGFITAGELNDLYRNAAFLVLPTFTESSSMPVLEAMVAGCPVIASDIDVHQEIAGDAAVLVDPRDVDAFVAAFDKMLTDASWRDAVVARGRARGAEFSWEECARRTADVYASAVSN